MFGCGKIGVTLQKEDNQTKTPEASCVCPHQLEGSLEYGLSSWAHLMFSKDTVAAFAEYIKHGQF